MASLEQFASVVLALIDEELSSSESSEWFTLIPDGYERKVKLLSAVRRETQNHTVELADLSTSAHEGMKDARRDPTCSFTWRRLYTDIALVWTLLDCFETTVDRDESYWKETIARLDNAIVIAGAPGEGRLDIILDSIEHIQRTHLPPRLPSSDISIPISAQINETKLLASSSHPVPILTTPPSLSAFRTRHSHAPFILRGFATDWPSISSRSWASKAYLQRIAARGRVVPVEVGRDYRTDDWTQRIMDWDEFLDNLFSKTKDQSECGSIKVKDEKNVMYLAQHDLFKQFPSLRSDIIIPDYIYASLAPPDYYPQYRPPATDEELILNIWLGPQGTISPAHIDPYFNFYTQVVGRKTVWLAPPSVSNAISPYSSQTPSTTPEDSTLSNTSRLDVFSRTLSQEADHEHEFSKAVVPVAMSAVLEEGDMLFFPPGWWHAMRSESVSFSVSMWF